MEIENSYNYNINNPKNNPNIIEADYSLSNLKGLSNNIFETNRKLFLENLNSKKFTFESNCIVILEGGKEIPRYDTDTTCYYFIQESNFYYLTGVTEPNFLLIIDLKDYEFLLVLDEYDERTKIFMHSLSLEDIKIKYNLNCISLENFVSTYIKTRNPSIIYQLKGTNTDSGLIYISFEYPNSFFSNFNNEINNNIEKLELSNIIKSNEMIYEVLVDSRSIKSEHEISIMNYVSKATVEGHVKVLTAIRPNLNERDMENVFANYVRGNYYYREPAYGFICGCGLNGATLHYQKNNSYLKDGELFLFDMGFKLGGYCSDVTSTAPVNGKFTKIQKELYDAVLNANREVLNNLKEGVNWIDMHLLAESIILKKLQELDLINKEFSIQELLDNRVYFYFQPHGLGHLIGIDVHDAGGYLSFTNKRSCLLGLSSLRTSRIMKAGTVITVEPGFYIIEFHLENAFNNSNISKYFNIDNCRKMYGFGGIRIEDVVLVQKEGCYNFCKDLPRKTKDIEAIMSKRK